MLLSFSDEQAKGLVDQLVPGVPGDVAADQLAVHAHPLAFHVELEGLVAGDSRLALLEQVHAVFLLVFNQVTAEKVIGGRDRLGVLEGHESQRASSQKVVPAFGKQLPVAPSLALLQDHHPDQYAYRSVGRAVTLGIEHAEYILVNAHDDLLAKQVMPGAIFQVFLLLGAPEVLRWR